MSDNDPKRFDIYLHMGEEMKSIKDVCAEDYSFKQLLLDAHDLALLHSPKCSKKNVVVSREVARGRGRKCKIAITCDYGLKKLFTTNHSVYVFFVKCNDGLGLSGNKVKRSNKLSLVKEASNVPPALISEVAKKRRMTTMPENDDPLASIAEVDEQRMMVSLNQFNELAGRTNNTSATHVYASVSVVENAPIASVSEVADERRNTTMVEKVPPASISEVAKERRMTTMAENDDPLASIAEVDEERMMVSLNQLNELADQTNNTSATRVYASVSMIENVPLASVSEVADERRNTKMVKNGSLAPTTEVEERITVSSNQLNQIGDRTTEEKPNIKVYVRKKRKVSSSEPTMLHRQDMVARVNFPLASISEVVEQRKIATMAENVPLASIAEIEEESMMVYSNQMDQMGDRTNHVSVKHVYVRKPEKVSSSQPAMLHHQDMVARVDNSVDSISEIAEERMMGSYNRLGDLSNHVHVYVRKRKPVKQVV